MPVTVQGPVTSSDVMIEVLNPGAINNLTIIMGEQILEGFGVGLYYSVPPFEERTFIGCVSNEKPTETFFTGWNINPQVNVLKSIILVARLEKLENLLMENDIKIQNDINLEIVRQIGRNFYMYLRNISKVEVDQSGQFVVPMNSLNDWLDKFKKQLQKDPNFMFKYNL